MSSRGISWDVFVTFLTNLIIYVPLANIYHFPFVSYFGYN